MSATAIIEDGTGVANANAYVDPVGTTATEFFAGHLYATAWNAATSDQKAAAVIMATRTLDAWTTWKGRPATVDQPLAWPRTGVVVSGFDWPENRIPGAVHRATLELAVELLRGDRTTDAAAAGVEKLSLGDGALSIDFTGAAATPRGAPPMVTAYVGDFGAVVAPMGNGAAMVKIRRA